jgi:hypothetical protein
MKKPQKLLCNVRLEKSRKMKADNQPATPASPRIDARRQPRFKIEIDITINSRTSGMLKGHTVDITEFGIAAMLPIEAPLGEIVELSFALSCGPVRIQATVRQRNAFRYGSKFVDQDLVHEFIRRTCRDLAIEQSLMLAKLPSSFRVPVTILLLFVIFLVWFFPAPRDRGQGILDSFGACLNGTPLVSRL